MTTIRIGTRGSALARWQADVVSVALQRTTSTSIVVIDSHGDRDLSTPLWRIDGVGVFTAALDQALLDDTIDVAVHSMKDVPTSIPPGLSLFAVLPRGSVYDVSIMASASLMDEGSERQLKIATSSRRRSAQWLQRYPHHVTVPLRGNIATRLSHLEDGTMDGIIMSEAALNRLQITPANMQRLEWMTPAPSQGAICVVGRSSDTSTASIVSQLDDAATSLATSLERRFLAALDGGCSSAVGAIATVDANRIGMRCTVHRIDGTASIEVSSCVNVDDADALVRDLIHQALQQGAHSMINEARDV